MKKLALIVGCFAITLSMLAALAGADKSAEAIPIDPKGVYKLR